LKVCDSAYIISQGHIVEFGGPEKILQSKIARSCYLGEEFCM
jgi:ABC-type lipopolysaccharide export system ATPase subunit